MKCRYILLVGVIIIAIALYHKAIVTAFVVAFITLIAMGIKFIIDIFRLF
ncbi:MAG: hypothetical protein LBL74_04945 [Bacteroidales bacterium]|jgi:hypothetical protein|nr:hypothetical protein [Bacteroidales bacterium]